MPDVQEVFRLATQRVRPDPGALDRQLHGRRSRTVRRKVGAFALVAALAAAGVVAALASRSEPQETDIGGVGPVGTSDVDYILDLDTGAIAPLPRAITDVAGEVGGFSVSHATGELAFNGVAEDGTTQVFVANADGSEIRQITDRPEGAHFPVWSASGRRLAYASPTEGTQNVFVFDRGSGRSTKVTFEEEGILGSFGFSPAGGTLIYTFDPFDGEGGRIRVVRLSDGRDTLLLDPVEGDAGDGVLSPDGRYLSYGGSATDDGENGLANRWLADADGTNPRLLVEGNFPSATWSPDSTRLAYWSLPEQEVFVIDVASGTATKVADGAWPVWLDDHTLIVEPESGL